MNLGDLITYTRFEIGEPSEAGKLGTQSDGTWTDTQIIQYLNNAQGLLSRDARIQATPATVTLIAGQQAYDFPTDCLEDGLRKITWTKSGNTIEVVDVGFDQVTDMTVNIPGSTLQPVDGAIYGTWSNQIYLYPIPVTTGDTMTIYYYKTLPDLVSVTDTSLLPARFHKALVKYAVAECQAAVEESQLQQLAMAEFERLSGQLVMERAMETRDRPARVRLRR